MVEETSITSYIIPITNTALKAVMFMTITQDSTMTTSINRSLTDLLVRSLMMVTLHTRVVLQVLLVLLDQQLQELLVGQAVEVV
jgi:hypothetical protein